MFSKYVFSGFLFIIYYLLFIIYYFIKLIPLLVTQVHIL